MTDLVELDDLVPAIPRERGIFCNRTLNLRSIRAIGYDMDYTLIHYVTEAWERRAYEYLRRRFEAEGWPCSGLEFDPVFAIRGLVLDLELGNVVKANRFGYVKRACHGTVPLDYDEQRRHYARTIVDLSEPRWVFLNTFFSLSEACLYAQLVDLLDQRRAPVVLGYDGLYQRVKERLDAAHMEGALKAEITADPARFIVPDPEAPLALLDQKRAGKKLLLITNSEWVYTREIMQWAFDPHLPNGMTWRDLFDVVIVAANKPRFFEVRAPLFEVVSEDGLLRPALALRSGGAFFGGSAGVVEKHLGLSGDEILFVGDHIYGDVHVSKSMLRWRTALIVRELEEEIRAEEAALLADERLAGLMLEKERLEQALCQARLEAQRTRCGYGPPAGAPLEELADRQNRLRAAIASLDAEIAPLAKAAGEVQNPRWGLLLRAGNDKSHLARQIERSADIYTSRVSNFMLQTPFAFLRPPRGSMPHDPQRPPPGPPAEGADPQGANNG